MNPKAASETELNVGETEELNSRGGAFMTVEKVDHQSPCDNLHPSQDPCGPNGSIKCALRDSQNESVPSVGSSRRTRWMWR